MTEYRVPHPPDCDCPTCRADYEEQKARAMTEDRVSEFDCPRCGNDPEDCDGDCEETGRFPAMTEDRVPTTEAGRELAARAKRPAMDEDARDLRRTLPADIEAIYGVPPLDVERLAQAWHMTQRCVHGVGAGEPLQTPGYLRPDREVAEAIYDEYMRLGVVKER